VIRSDNPEYVNERRVEINGVFDEARGALIISGFNPDRITTKIVTGSRSRAAAVAR